MRVILEELLSNQSSIRGKCMKGTALWIRPAEAGDPRPGYELIQILNTGTDSYTMNVPEQSLLSLPCPVHWRPALLHV